MSSLFTDVVILFTLIIVSSTYQTDASICNPDYETGVPIALCLDGSEVDSSGCCGRTAGCQTRLGFCHCASGLWCRHQWHVILFQESNYDGASGKWMILKGSRDGNECLDLPVAFNDSISSINTHSFCAKLYDAAECQGPAVEVSPGSNCHKNLNDCGLNDKVSSIRPC